MTNEEFKVWLGGFLTLTSEEFIDNKQVNIIFNHANLVKAVSGKFDKFNETFINSLKMYIKKTSPLYVADIKVLYMTELQFES